MPRRIPNKALIQTLKDAKVLLEQNITHQRWMITKCWDAVNFGATTQKAQEVEKSIRSIEDSARCARDIDHAVAALEQETDDE